MPITKKDRIHREQKKADAAGTRAKVNPNGTPVKAAKPKSICAFCRKELVRLFFFNFSNSRFRFGFGVTSHPRNVSKEEGTKTSDIYLIYI